MCTPWHWDVSPPAVWVHTSYRTNQGVSLIKILFERRLNITGKATEGDRVQRSPVPGPDSPGEQPMPHKIHTRALNRVGAVVADFSYEKSFP